MQKITPPVDGHLPASKTTLAYIRSALQGVITSGTAAGTFGGFPLGKVCVAGKTGTAQVFGKNSTSVFASFAPCDHPKYVVVVMIPDSGYGADVSGPAVRQIWDALYGLQGSKAALPGGNLPPLPQHHQRRHDRADDLRRDGQATDELARIRPGQQARRRPPCPGSASYRRPGPGPPGRRQRTPARHRHRPVSAAAAAAGCPQLLRRVFGPGSPLRQLDWILLVAVLALSLIGTLLVWSATDTPGHPGRTRT